MKMFYGNTPITSLNIKHYEMSTNDCDMVASDLQAGKTAVARGQKITGTGKAFEFALYGNMSANLTIPIPSEINTITIASTEYPILLNKSFDDVRSVDFSTVQTIANVTIDGVLYPITVQVANSILTISCSQNIKLEIFYGRDNYT